jgi:hypothetical protein
MTSQNHHAPTTLPHHALLINGGSLGEGEMILERGYAILQEVKTRKTLA